MRKKAVVKVVFAVARPPSEACGGRVAVYCINRELNGGREPISMTNTARVENKLFSSVVSSIDGPFRDMQLRRPPSSWTDKILTRKTYASRTWAKTTGISSMD